MKLLHVIASPRLEGSRTLGISQVLLDEMAARIPDLSVETIDLFEEDLPAIAGDNIEAKYTLLARRPVGREHAESWAEIEREIERFRSADAYVISTPMWNFGIPYVLKYYIDCIVQPGYLFHFNEQGYPVPLLEDRPMIVVSSSGSDFSDASPYKAADNLEPYLRTIFGFVGLTDLTFVRAHGVDISAEVREAALAQATAEARAVAASDRWVRVAA